MGKYYAVQVDPEHQDSPFEFLEVLDDDIDWALDGNREYKSFTFPEYDRVNKNIEDASEAYHDLKRFNSHYKNLSAILDDLLWRAIQKRYTNKQIHAWKTILDASDVIEDENICAALSLMMDCEYTYGYIRGSCQSDWQMLYHPVLWDEKTLERFTGEYFNTGTEWMVTEGPLDVAPADPSNIDGTISNSFYTTEWKDEIIRAEIAKELGVKPADVVLLKYVGRKYTPIYEAV